jgi:hypothetical protein
MGTFLGVYHQLIDLVDNRIYALTGLGKYHQVLEALYELSEINTSSETTHAALYIYRAEIHKHLGNVL